MRHAFALITILILGVGATAAPASLSPIQPLFLDDTPACTAFSVNKQERLWITAAHCTMQDATTLGLGSASVHVEVVRRDVDVDLAMLRGGLPTPPLDLADNAPRTSDHITIDGFPMGQTAAVTFFGRVSNPSFVFPDETIAVAVFDTQGLPGMSGAPIMVRGRVVSVFQGIYKGKVGQLAWGSTWARLKDFVGPVWEGER